MTGTFNRYAMSNEKKTEEYDKSGDRIDSAQKTIAYV